MKIVYKKLSIALGAAVVSLLVCAGSLSAAAEETTAPPVGEPYSDGFVYSDDGTVSYLQNGLPLCGYFSITPAVMKGDIDQSAEVNAVDAAAILVAAAEAGAGGHAADFTLELEFGLDSGETAFLFADVNDDTIIDAADAAEILAYAAAKGAGEAAAPLGFAMYYADETGVLQQGFISDPDGVIYYAGEDYALLTGWQNLADGRYYFYDNGSMQTAGFVQIGDAIYLFTESGAVLTNAWYTEEGSSYYFSGTGAMVKGFTQIEGIRYYFDESGVLQTGWAELSGGRYYLGEDGAVRTGFQEIDGVTYYFDENGALQTGFCDIDGVRCYFGEDGAMQTGWLELGESRYYLGEDGVMRTGLQEIDGSRYYFDADGRMCTAWQVIDGKSYYFGIDGTMYTGWQSIANDQYYFHEDGTMATDTTIDGMVIGSDGTAISQALYNITVKADEILAANGTSVANIYSYMRSTNRYKRIEATKTLAQIEELGWTHFVNYSMNNYYVVCYYMAAKMDFLLREAGHECRVVYATHGTGDHYWNQVNINGTWVNYDCTNGYNAYTMNQMIAAGNYTILDYLTPEYR